MGVISTRIGFRAGDVCGGAAGVRDGIPRVRFRRYPAARLQICGSADSTFARAYVMPGTARRSGRAFPPVQRRPIIAIFWLHSAGPVWCTDVPLVSTATVTGMSSTVNS